MGHRANLVVLREGQATVRYSHWGAITIPQDIFYGPEITLKYVEALEAVDGWLDELWCEGAVLLDFDSQKLIFFGGEEIASSPALRRSFLPLLRCNWTGWDVRWAERGIVDIVLELGIDVEHVRVPDDVEELAAPDLEENPERKETLLTVRSSEGAVRDYAFAAELTNLLGLGPKLLGVLEERTPSPLPREQENEVSQGAYLDISKREITVWWGRPPDQRNGRKIPERWPGWIIKRQHGGLSVQVELSGRDAAAVRMSEEEAVSRVVAILSAQSRVDPQRLLDSFLEHNAGQTVQVNPHFFSYARPEVDETEKRAILQRALDSLRK